MKKRLFHFGGFIGTILLLHFVQPNMISQAVHEQVQAPGEFNQCKIENRTFQDGEEVVYKLYYNWKFVWFAAGEVVFRVKDLGSQYYVSAEGRTYRSYDTFFRVRDSYECYMDKNTLLPKTSIRKVEEGKYRLYDKVTFDRNRQVARSLRGKSREVAKIEEYPIESCIHDILSIIYYARNLDFDNMQSGQEMPISIFMDKETWPLRVTYKGKDDSKRIKGNGKFKTLQFSPEVISGEIFDEGTEMNVWVSNDQNRIPLLIESPLSVGSVKAVIKSYKGLKHDLEAGVE